MKILNKLLKGLLVFVLTFGLFSCNDDDFSAKQVTVNEISANSAYPNDPVSLIGLNLETVQFVFVGEQQAEFELNGETISFIVPERSVVGPNFITLAMANDYRVKIPFEVLLRPIPFIDRFDAWVAPGGNLTISGLSFNPEYNPVVTIDGVEATITSNTNTELVVTVPGVTDDEFLDITITSIHGSTTTSTAFIARNNILANGDFYEGSGDDFTGWEKLNGADRMTAVTDADAYGEGRSMRVDPASANPWDNQFASDGVQLTLGEEYTLVLWGKAIDEGAFMRFSISQYDGNGADYFYGDDKIFTNTWAPYTWTFTVTNDLPIHRAVLDMGASTGAFIIDHIALVEGAFGATTGPAEELLNGSFEDGLTNWESLNGTHEISTTEAFCGDSSLTATGAGANPWDTQIASDPMLLQVGTDYEISFWAKAAGPDGIFRVSMSQYDGNGADFFYSPDLDIPEDWTYFSFVTTAQTTASGDYRLLFDMGATTQTFFVDGVSIKEYDPADAASEYVNGGFEDGLTGWESLNGTHEISTAEFYSGSSSLTATGAGANPWDTQIATDPIALTVGQDYKISFWAKAAGPDGVFRISMSQYDGNGADFFYSDDLEIPEDWEYFTFIVNAQTTASGDHRLLFDMGATTQTFFVDDVSVVEYDACD